MERIGIEARLVWALLTGEGKNCLEEGGSPYAYEALELLEARELFNLMGRIRETLAARGIEADEDHSGEPTVVHIGKKYDIRIGGIELPLQPLLKTIFIFFLRHPEGICLKDRANYADEISSIYAVISPETSETVGATHGSPALPFGQFLQRKAHQLEQEAGGDSGKRAIHTL